MICPGLCLRAQCGPLTGRMRVLLLVALALLGLSLVQGYKPACDVIKMMQANVKNLKRNIKVVERRLKEATRIMLQTQKVVEKKRSALVNQYTEIREQRKAIAVRKDRRRRSDSAKNKPLCP